MMTRPFIYRRPSWWRRFCDQHHIHPLALLCLLVCEVYIGILAVQCIRHALTGSW